METTKKPDARPFWVWCETCGTVRVRPPAGWPRNKRAVCSECF